MSRQSLNTPKFFCFIVLRNARPVSSWSADRRWQRSVSCCVLEQRQGRDKEELSSLKTASDLLAN